MTMETISTSELSVSIYQTVTRNNPDDSPLHTRRRENLKSHNRMHICLVMESSNHEGNLNRCTTKRITKWTENLHLEMLQRAIHAAAGSDQKKEKKREYRRKNCKFALEYEEGERDQKKASTWHFKWSPSHHTPSDVTDTPGQQKKGGELEKGTKSHLYPCHLSTKSFIDLTA
jgi:hypothetical protein